MLFFARSSWITCSRTLGLWYWWRCPIKKKKTFHWTGGFLREKSQDQSLNPILGPVPKNYGSTPFKSPVNKPAIHSNWVANPIPLDHHITPYIYIYIHIYHSFRRRQIRDSSITLEQLFELVTLFGHGSDMCWWWGDKHWMWPAFTEQTLENTISRNSAVWTLRFNACNYKHAPTTTNTTTRFHFLTTSCISCGSVLLWHIPLPKGHQSKSVVQNWDWNQTRL